MLEHPNFQNHCCFEVLLRQRSDLLGEQGDHLFSLKMFLSHLLYDQEQGTR